MSQQTASPSPRRQTTGGDTVALTLCCLVIAAGIALSPNRCFGQPAGATPERQTEELGNDLIEVLLRLGRADDAIQISTAEITSHEHRPLEQAKWIARLAESLATKNASTVFGVKPSLIPARQTKAVVDATKPIESFLATHPNSSATLFLQASQLKIRQSILKSAILAASISVTNENVSDHLLKQISLLQRDAEELLNSASSMWSVTSQNLDHRDAAQFHPDQYERLVRELSLNRIQLAILVTELFSKDGDDYRSAAATAIAIAEDALIALPDDSDAKGLARRLLIEAQLRSGDLPAARRLLDSIPPSTVMSNPAWVSLLTRLLDSEGKRERAMKVCETFYRSAAHRSSPADSLPVDFAKLELLIAAKKSDTEITAWLETIEKRGGPFARRRAEAMAINALRFKPDGGGGSNAPSVNPSLIALQGEDALRRGEPGQAANLLREAAIAERDPNMAFAYAGKSAAAAIAGKDTLSAISVLETVARKNVGATGAVDLMMQAALLSSKPGLPSDDPKLRLNRLVAILEELCQTWPSSDQAITANAWLCKIFVALKRQNDAARSALELLSLGGRVEQVAPVTQQWFSYLKDLDFEETNRELEVLAQTFQELIRDFTPLTVPVAQASTLLLEPDDLKDLTRQGDLIAQLHEPYATIGSFRLAATKPTQTPPLPSLLKDDLVTAQLRWRLQRDALLSPANHQLIGERLLQLPGGDDWQIALAKFWNRRDADSITAIKELASSNGKPERLRSGIQVLMQSESDAAKRAAVDLADLAASKFKIGTADWYQMKWRAASLLSILGETADAKKRAQYILLLHRPDDADLKARFEQLAR